MAGCKCEEVCWIEGPRCLEMEQLTCCDCGETFCIDKDLPIPERPSRCDACQYDHEEEY